MKRERIFLSLWSVALLILFLVSMSVSSLGAQEPVHKVLNPRGYMLDGGTSIKL